MSKQIDERVVEMRFDNAQFERNVSTSMSTRDKLKKALNLDGAAKSLENIASASKNVNFDVMGKSVDTIASKFSALETIAVGALLKLGSQAVTTGENLLKALTIDQIIEGWNKYADKTTSVQTIMAATGKSIDEVNESLEKLIWFTDETSYSMTDMTNNIGKFTSQGIDLDTSVTAMEGISTWASLSGGSIEEASRAMYNLSQALGVGAVKLQDWKSIENANMATKEFKEMAMEAAVATGDLTKSFDDAGNAIYKTSKDTEVTAANFSSTLSDAWFTSDALISVLNNYGQYADGVYELYDNLGEGVSKTTSEIIGDLKQLRGADDKTILDYGYTEDQIELVRKLADEVGGIGQKSFAAAQEAKTFSEVITSVKEAVASGWSQTFETIFGNYEEAKVLWTDLANAMWDVFASGGEARNELLTEALKGIGKSDVIEYISDLTGMKEEAIESLSELGKTAGYTSEEFKDLANGLAEGDENMQSVIENLLKFEDSGEDVVKYISDLTGMKEEAIETLRKLGMYSGYASEEFKDMANGLAEGDEAMEAAITALLKANELTGREMLVNSFWNAWEGIGALLSTIKDAFREIFPATTAEQLYNFTKGLNDLTDRFKAFLTESEKGQELLTNLKNTFKGVFAVIDIVKEVFSSLWRALSPASSAVGGLLTNILGLSGSFGEWLSNLDKTIKENDTFYKVFKKIVDFISSAITTVKNFATVLGEKLNFPSIDEAKESVKSFINIVKEKIGAPGLELLRELFERICDRAKQVRDAISDMKDGVVNSMEKIDGAVSGSKFITVFTGIWEFIKKIGGAVINFFGNVISGLINVISNTDFSGILDFLNVLISGGILVGIKKLLNIGSDIAGTVKGFGSGVIDILNGVRGCLEAYQQNLKASALLKIAGAVAILAAALLVISNINSEALSGSLTAISVLLVELMGSMKAFSLIDINARGMNKTATAMIKISAALLILSLALKNIAQLDSNQLVEGLTGIGVILAELALFLNTAKFNNKGITKTATGMILLAAAIKILASAVKDLSELSWEDMAKGLLGVGILLAEVDVFLNTAKFSGKSVLTATGVVALAAAIKILASACKDFGAMSWEEIGKGLASIGALLAEITVFTKLTGNAKHVIATGLALIEIGAAMKIFASAMKSFGSMSWEEIAKGLISMGIALAEITAAVNLMPKNMVGVGLGLITVGAALKIVASVLGTMGGMSWEEIAKGLVALGGALAELSIGLNLMNGTLKGSAALLVASAALLVMAPALKILGVMSWESIAKGLVAIAGAFTVLGVAAAVLSPLTGSILALSAALALIGVGSVAIGAGLVLIGTGLTTIAVGLTALATAISSSSTIIVAGLSAIILGIAALIPSVAEKIGEAIIVFCGVIANAEAVKAVVLSLVDMLLTCVPTIADGALQLIVGVLDALVTYTPKIIDLIMQFLVEVLEGIARNIPQLIQAAMDVVGAFFSGLLEALGNIDVDAFIKGIEAVGLLTALVAALGLVVGLIPAAMVGVLGVGAVATELALVLAALGGLAQISGFEWIISEGGKLLKTIGEAIGGFVGGIVGGFMSGVSSSFPRIGSDLSEFMSNVQPFIEGASGISSELLTGIKNLTGAILLITAADLLEGLTSWLTGGSSLSDFGKELVPFGESMVAFSDSISGLDSDLVSKAAMAGKTFAEMAATLPNSGGVVGFFTGENDMDAFGKQLVVFGTSMVLFGNTVKNLDADAIQNAAIAGKAMAELAATLPNTGGAVEFFTGGNDMDDFGEQLIPFGKAIKEYSEVVDGMNVDAVTNSAIAGKALVELADTVPNTGGVVSWFAGDNDLSRFGEQLIDFGWAMSEYSEAVSDIKSDVIINSTTAGQALVELAKTVPNTGGVVSWFTGDNDLSDFGEQIVAFGKAMKEYSDVVSGIGVDAIVASTTAGQALVELQNTLPNVGGIVDFFTGGNDLEQFGNGIKSFGESMKSYGDAISGINADEVTASATAALALAELQTTLPNTGGVVEFFTGGNNLEKFGDGIESFGKAMKSYGESVAGINSEAITASTISAQSLFELQATLPKVGGVVEFFTGGSNFSRFSKGISSFGEAMKSYGESVTGINSDAITASAIAAQSLFELQATLPNIGGVVEFFAGGSNMKTFGQQLVPFGTAIKEYSEVVDGMSVDAVTNSATAGKALTELTNIDLSKLSGVVSQVRSIIDLTKDMKDIDTKSVGGFSKALRELAEGGIAEFTNAFSDSSGDIVSSVNDMLTTVSDTISSNSDYAAKGMQDVMEALK